MARQLRIEYEGALYHVLSRGNEGRSIFLDDEDRSLFLEALSQLSKRFEIDLCAYVLMTTHYHLLLETKRANLSRSMQWFATTYTRRFNVRHNRSGHLFQGRFKGILVEDDSYLMKLSCYIHRNPLRAHMVERLVNYQWSSYKAYAYGESHPNWLKTNLILKQVEGKDKHKGYREIVQKYSREERRIFEDMRHGLFFGSKGFIDRIKSAYPGKMANKEVAEKVRAGGENDPKVLLKKGAEILNCDIDEMRFSRRISQKEKEGRDLLIYVLWETGCYRAHEIGGLLGLGYSSVSKRVGIIEYRISKERELRKRYDRLKSLIKL